MNGWAMYYLFCTVVMGGLIYASVIDPAFDSRAEVRTAVAVGSSKSSYPLPMTLDVPATGLYKKTEESAVVLSGITTCHEVPVYDVNLVIAHDEWSEGEVAAMIGVVHPMVRPAVFEGVVGQQDASKCSIEAGRVRFFYSEQEMGEYILTGGRMLHKKAYGEAVKSLMFAEPAGKDTRGKVKLFQ